MMRWVGLQMQSQFYKINDKRKNKQVFFNLTYILHAYLQHVVLGTKLLLTVIKID